MKKYALRKLKLKQKVKSIEECEEDGENYIENTNTYIIFVTTYLKSNSHFTA